MIRQSLKVRGFALPAGRQALLPPAERLSSNPAELNQPDYCRGAHREEACSENREAHSPASAPPEEKSIVSRNRAGEGVNKPSSPRHADSFAPVYRPERSLRLRAGGRQRLATTRRATADRHAARCASRDLCSGGAPRRYTPSTDLFSGTRHLRFEQL